MQKIGTLPFFCIIIIILINFSSSYSRVYLKNGESPQLLKEREVYWYWKGLGIKGRVIIYFSRHLNFLALHESEFLNLRTGFPVRTIDMMNAYESVLSDENFLWVAVEAGIARKVYHIIPERTLSERMEVARELRVFNVKQGEPWQVQGNIIKGHYRHTPRYVLTLKDLKEINEKVVLAFHPSYFEFDETPEEVYNILKKQKIQADSISFCISEGYTNSEAIERLLRLKWMIENIPF